MNTDQADVRSICAKLGTIPTAIIADVLAAAGLPDQALSSEMAPIGAQVTFAGPAVCISGSDDPPANPELAASYVFEVDRVMHSGCVAVAATGRHRIGAVVGGNTVASWRRSGCIALVTDGLVRDLSSYDTLPVHAAGRTPLNNKARWYYSSLETPVKLPGLSADWVFIEPGDIVCGDGDGVIIVPSRYAGQVASDARITATVEAWMLAEISAGRDREEVYRNARRFNHIKKIMI
jgi:4-hydroxy-4-methyl-2-oxoglutarate aldolase